MAVPIRAKTQSVVWTNDIIRVENLDLGIGSKTLLQNTSFTIQAGDRIALLGRNGCGKSTLFHWISQQRELAKDNGISVYEVAQELPPSNASITDIVLSAHLERGQLYARMAELESKENLDDAEILEYERLGEQMTSMNTEADRPTVKKILHGLGFTVDEMDRSLSTFSGGWRARVAIAQGLFMRPDLLLLDEPTNHLDMEGVLWLAAYLAKWNKAFIVISHNISFVREVASVFWLIEYGILKAYRCKYSRFQKQYELERKKAVEDWKLVEKEVAKLKKVNTPVVKKQIEEIITKAAAKGIVRPPLEYRPKFFFTDADTKYTGYLIKTEDVSLGYNERVVLNHVTFGLYTGSRIALVGENGSGKSTLLRMLYNELEPMKNGVVERRKGLRVVKFDQHFYHSLPENQTPLEYIQQYNGTPIELIRKILGASGLEGAAHCRAIGTLSGGQKARVYFAFLASQQPDILLMDEPTNHLDIETIDGLINALKDFEGGAIIVSHDLHFLEEVATEVWQTRDGTLVKLSVGLDGLEMYVESVLEKMEL